MSNHDTIHLDPVLRTGIENLTERYENHRQMILTLNANITRQSDEARAANGTNQALLPHEIASSVPTSLHVVPEPLTFEEIAKRLLARSADNALLAYMQEHGLHLPREATPAAAPPGDHTTPSRIIPGQYLAGFP